MLVIISTKLRAVCGLDTETILFMNKIALTDVNNKDNFELICYWLKTSALAP